MDCPICGNPLTIYDRTCPECGMPVPQAPKSAPTRDSVCAVCGAPLDPDSGRCPWCTTQEAAAESIAPDVYEPAPESEPESEPAAAPVPEAEPAAADDIVPAAVPLPAAPAPAAAASLPEESGRPSPWLLLAFGVLIPIVPFIIFAVFQSKHRWAGFELLSYAICGALGQLLCLIGLGLAGLLAPAAALVVWGFFTSSRS